MSNVIRVYNTEANALAGGTTGMISDTSVAGTHDTVDNDEGSVYNIEDAFPYYIYNRYYYRIEANEPVSEFHIDWDDGVDSSEEKSNLQIIKLKTPKTYCVVDHVYTSSKEFYPLIRVKSIDGFLSKFYTHHNNKNATGRLRNLLKFPPAITTLTRNQNEFSILSLTKSNNAEIPRFLPSNLPPVAVLKTDRKRIFAGIDNKIIDEVGSYPLLYAFSDMSSGTQPSVKLTVQTEDKHIREYTIDAGNVLTGDPTSGSSGYNSASSDQARKHVPFGNFNDGSATSTNSAAKLLRAELLDADNLADTNRIYINVKNAGTNHQAISNVDENRTVCVLSNGNPIVDITDPLYSANVDASESFTRDPDVDINAYFIDTDFIGDKGFKGDVTTGGSTDVYQAASSISSNLGFPTDALDNSNYNRGTVAQLNVSYTHGAHGHLKDSDGRFLDFSRLVRAQVQDTTSINFTGEPENLLSRIEHYQRDLYTSTVDSGNIRIPTSEASEACILYSNADGFTNGINNSAWKDLSSRALDNRTMIGENGTYKLQGNTAVDEGGSNTSSDAPENYLLLAKTDIFDRVYFRCSNEFDHSDTATNLEMTAWYATTDGWKSLEILDNTKGLTTSGSVTFKKPADWKKTTAALINGNGTPWAGPVDDDASGSADPVDIWDFSAYGILIGMNAVTGGDIDKIKVTGIWPYSNSHSQLIKVVDPHHVSLNNIAIAQSISFKRQGKFQIIQDRFGKSEIRKMGVNGGQVTFGSVDLGDTDVKGNRKKIKQYQQNATPVFLDVTHKSGEKTRFFGVITGMSEDHPPGAQFPKYAVQMQISHIIELSSTGTLLSDKISIGGNIDDARKFFVSS